MIKDLLRGFCVCKQLNIFGGNNALGGQMGRATGAAAMLCKKYDTSPRGVYEGHIEELQDIVLGRGDYEHALKAD